MSKKRFGALAGKLTVAVLTLSLSAAAVIVTPQEKLRKNITATIGRIDAAGNRFLSAGFMTPLCKYLAPALHWELFLPCYPQVSGLKTTRMWWGKLGEPTCDPTKEICSASCDQANYLCRRYESRVKAGDTRMRNLTRTLEGQRKRIETKKLGYEKTLAALAERKNTLNANIANESQICAAQQTGYLTSCRKATSLQSAISKVDSRIALNEDLLAIAIDGIARAQARIDVFLIDNVTPIGLAREAVLKIGRARDDICATAANICAQQPAPTPTPAATPVPTCPFGTTPQVTVNTTPIAPNKFNIVVKNTDSSVVCAGKNTLFSISITSPIGFRANIFGGYNNTSAVLLGPDTSSNLEIVVTPPSTAQQASRTFVINVADNDGISPAHMTATVATDLFVGGNPSPTPTASPTPKPTAPMECILGQSPELAMSDNPDFPGKFKLTIKNNDPLVCAGMNTQFHISAVAPDGWAAGISGPNVDMTLYVTLAPQQSKTVDFLVSGPIAENPYELRTFTVYAADYDGQAPNHPFIFESFDLMTGDAPTPTPSQSPSSTPSPTPTLNPYGCDGSPAIYGPSIGTPQISLNAAGTIATVTWNTTQASDGIINYGLQPTYGTEVRDVAFTVGAHSLSFPVSPGTNYWSLRSCTGSGATYGCTAICGQTIDPTGPTPTPSATPSPTPTATPPPSCLYSDSPVLSVTQDPNNPSSIALTLENSDYLADENCPSVSTTFSIVIDPNALILALIYGPNVDPTGQTITLAPGESKTVDLILINTYPLPQDIRTFNISAIDMDGHEPHHAVLTEPFDLISGG